MIRTTALTRCGSVADLARYDHILVLLSGDKDSIACLDAALAAGACPARIELNDHGGDGAGPAVMDGSVTTSYCRAPAASVGLPLFRPGRPIALTEPSARPAQQPWESM
jgi:hypothetical protein